MEELIEDYERRLETLAKLLRGRTHADSISSDRIRTKQGYYNAFIAELRKYNSSKDIKDDKQYSEHDLRHVFESFDQDANFDDQLKEFNSDI